MLEFCQTVKPTLEDYEADGVRIPSRVPCISDFGLTLGLAYVIGRFRQLEKEQDGQRGDLHRNIQWTGMSGPQGRSLRHGLLIIGI
jgi:hypothetical protein